MRNSLLLTSEEQEEMLPAFDEHLLFALERRYLDFLDISRLELAMNAAENEYDIESNLRIIRLDEVTYQGDASDGLHLLNMQNVLAALKDDSHSAIQIIRNDGTRTSVYYGLSRRLGVQTSISTHEYARMLAQTMHGNFLGVKMNPLTADEIDDEIIDPILNQREVLAFPGIPSLRLKDSKATYVQGIDRFVEGMRGEKYVLAIIAEPVTLPDIDGMIKNLFDLGTSVHSLVKSTVQKMKGSSDTVNIGMFGMKGVSDATTFGEATTGAAARLGPGSLLNMAGGAAGGALTAAAGAGLLGTKIGAIVGSVIPGAGTLIGAGIGAGIGAVAGAGITFLTGAPLFRTHSFTRSIANTTANMLGGGLFGGYARGWTRSRAVTQEVLNKSAEHCEKLIDTYIKRLQDGKNLGFWNVGVYLLAQNRYTQLRGQGLLRSCLSGDETFWEPIRHVALNNEALGQYLINFNNPRYNLLMYGSQQEQVEKAVSFGSKIREFANQVQRPVEEVLSLFRKVDDAEKVDLLEQIRRQPGKYSREDIECAWKEIENAQLGHPLGQVMGGVSTPLNTEELSIIMNVPREEVQGITIREAAPFGVNYTRSGDATHQITIGHIVHKREVLSDAPFDISQQALRKHGFVCGVTGSGKTNTIMNLLRQSGVPFMVIEPAKSEYRQLLNEFPDLRVFTLGNESISPFRLNPFEFIQGVDLLTHIDYLKAVFNAAFPMYASMPYLLEEAIIEVYLDKGWEISTSTNRYFNVNDNEHFHDYLPTLDELLVKVERVVDRKQYAQELSMDLSAALKARLSSLLCGSKGLMLNTQQSTPIDELMCENVVLELRYMGDDDEKTFLMGLIFARLYEYREAQYHASKELNHITVIEEAHRLLKRVPEYASMESTNTRGKAVETFSNILSEVREYGEGVLIVDQIPTKLTADVVKNTSLKIVHKLLAKDDRDFVGATMNLTHEQNCELPLLRTGNVVVHREDLDKPFLVRVPSTKDRLGTFNTHDCVKTAMASYHEAHAYVFWRLPGFDKDNAIIETFSKCDFRRFDVSSYQAIISLATVFLESRGPELANIVRKASDLIEDRLRPRTKTEHLCFAIWYTNRMFLNINEAYWGHYDQILRAHRSFIDAYFSIPQGEDPRPYLESYSHAMKGITNHGSGYEPMATWVVAKSNATATVTSQMVTGQPDMNFSRLNQVVERLCQDLTLGVQVPDRVRQTIHEALLQAIMTDNPQAGENIRLYKQRVFGGEH